MASSPRRQVSADAVGPAPHQPQAGLFSEAPRAAHGNGEFYNKARSHSGLCSMSQASTICNCSRDTIRRLIAAKNIKAAWADDVRENQLFKILDVVEAFLERKWKSRRPKDEKKRRSGAVDISKLTMQERRAYFDSEQKRLELMERAGELVSLESFRTATGELITNFVSFLQSLPDELERDCGLSGEVVTELHRRINEQRLKLYESVTSKKNSSTKRRAR